MNQRRVSGVKFLGELYSYQLVESNVIFRTLYLLIQFGCNADGEGGGNPSFPPRHPLPHGFIFHCFLPGTPSPVDSYSIISPQAPPPPWIHIPSFPLRHPLPRGFIFYRFLPGTPSLVDSYSIVSPQAPPPPWIYIPSFPPRHPLPRGFIFYRFPSGTPSPVDLYSIVSPQAPPPPWIPMIPISGCVWCVSSWTPVDSTSTEGAARRS